jgi:hypothetical protein
MAESIVFLNYTRTLAVIGLIRWMIILGPQQLPSFRFKRTGQVELFTAKLRPHL